MFEVEIQQRLFTLIGRACPFVDASVGVFGQSATVRFTPTAVATPQQIRDAQGVVDTFDWSAQAFLDFKAADEPLLKNISDLVAAALAAINAYLTIADTATAVQVRDEVKKIDQRQKILIQAVARLISKLT